MIVFPNCKINLGLHILDKRQDGFHNLQTVFIPVKWYDIIEVIQNDVTKSNQTISVQYSGIEIKGDDGDNLCVKAYHLLCRENYPLPSISMYLHKSIPMGAGLGGGSADGAFMLRLLNEKFNLQISEAKLIEYSAVLGSDCPFFIKNTPCFAEGRGEILEPIQVSLDGYKILIINPSIHINTGWAFSQLNPNRKQTTSLKEAIQLPIETWRNSITNDFETPAFTKYPEIEKIKKQLYQNGAVFALMSGSGSTVYGIFPPNSIIETKEFEKYLHKVVLV